MCAVMAQPRDSYVGMVQRVYTIARAHEQEDRRLISNEYFDAMRRKFQLYTSYLAADVRTMPIMKRRSSPHQQDAGWETCRERPNAFGS
jgi:hypothetical protein